MKLYARGFDIKAIASALGKSVSTINNQLWRVKKRFNLSNYRDIILLAYFLNVA